MSLSDIVLDQLEGYIFREQYKRSNGIRTISGEDEGGLLPDFLAGFGGSLWDALTSIGGFLLSVVGSAIKFTCSKVWGALVSSTQFLWNFNWDVSDEQLDARIATLNNQIIAQLGGTLGNAAGYLVCGVTPGALMIKFNKILAIRILREVGEEALQELAGNLSLLCDTAFKNLIQIALIWTFKNARRAIKWFVGDPNSFQGKIVRRLFGSDFDNALQGWGDGKDNYSFANQFEEYIDSIQSDWVRIGLQEFFEEFGEACVEAGFIVAGEIDQWISQSRITQNLIMGEEKIVQIIPNRQAPQERLILAGREKLIKATLPTTLSVYQQIENRDVGQLVGEPLRENLRRAPSELTLKLQLFNFPNPPFYRVQERTQEVQITIPGVKRTALDWDLIKGVLGGAAGYQWGRFKTITKLVNEHGQFSGRLRIYGATASISQIITENVLSLTEYTPVTQDTTEEIPRYRREGGQALAKNTVRVYPTYMTLTNSQKVVNEEEGRSELTGAYKRKRDRLELWTEEKPSHFDEVINDLLSA